MGEEEEECWRERTEEGGEAQKAVDDAGPEPRVRRQHAEARKGKGVDFLESPQKGTTNI